MPVEDSGEMVCRLCGMVLGQVQVQTLKGTRVIPYGHNSTFHGKRVGFVDKKSAKVTEARGILEKLVPPQMVMQMATIAAHKYAKVAKEFTMPVTAALAGIIYHMLRRRGIVRTMQEISELANISLSEMRKSVRRTGSVEGVGSQPYKARDYLSRIQALKPQVPSRTWSKIRRDCDRRVGGNPRVTAAVVSWHYLRDVLSPGEIAKVCHVAASGIPQTHGRLYDD